MRIFLVRSLARFVRRENISLVRLREAIARAEKGSIDADLGGGLIKQRIARPGSGRSGGYRTIIAYRSGSRAVFLYGFAKNERDNIDSDELVELRKVGANWLNAANETLASALEDGALKEVTDDQKENDSAH
ncbi:MAG TPA: type II toxin-antitoxin system RelE/ParE family toxin [Terracidiphilus sp.]|nr:type II toxin-antitoxin system RelE/ParE family toxin [Terracidiphilus sp.]